MMEIMKFPDKKIVLFDLDDTLARSKEAISPSMGIALAELLKHSHVGVITGGKWEQCKKQVIDQLPQEAEEYLHKLHILPTCGARLHGYNNNTWVEKYAELLTDEEASESF